MGVIQHHYDLRERELLYDLIKPYKPWWELNNSLG